MAIRPCPKCMSADVLRERRIDGNTECRKCGYKSTSNDWDGLPPLVIPNMTERLKALYSPPFEFRYGYIYIYI